jgi:hypothetical protein
MYIGANGQGKAREEYRDVLCDGRNVSDWKGPVVSIPNGDSVNDEPGMRTLLELVCNKRVSIKSMPASNLICSDGR